MKEIKWVGSTYKDICSFPEATRQMTGYQLHLLQMGDDPTDWKPMSSVGAGVREIRVHEGGEFRVIYVAQFDEGIYVLHAFQKKTQKTSKKDIELAKSRFKAVLKERPS